ncbi:MAG: ABC transporter permease subunit [Alphaproteobacteria bacterium]|nr:ABC transporter permease subunit [Alphaproteobacteria bacterium]
MRLRPVLAIAWRDLRIEFKGRRAALLPGVAAFVLGPLAVAPSSEDLTGPTEIPVAGDVPEDVRALPQVVEVDDGKAVWFRAASPEAPQLQLLTARVPTAIRDALDAGDTHTPVVTHRPEPLEVPNRSLFLALIAASMLTGSLAQSIPGERSQGTLEALLTAAVTRSELVIGKWLAWGGAGGVAALAASLVTVLLGRQALGLWVLAVPWVALGTVALGFFLVRKANDVVGGATVAIRMLPVALTVLGMTAWYLGGSSPWLGASIPLGGVLVAAGDVWEGVGPTAWAIAVTGGSSLALVGATARDLEAGERTVQEAGLAGAFLASGTAAVGWWCSILGAFIWAAGRAPERTASISPASGVWAGGLCLAAIAGVRVARDPRAERILGPWQPGVRWLAAVLVVPVIVAAPALAALAPDLASPVLVAGRERMLAALQPTSAGPAGLLLVVLAQEVLFRGWVQKQAGSLAGAVLFAVVVTPFDPAVGLALGLALGLLVDVAQGAVVVAVAARLVAAALPWSTTDPWTAGVLAASAVLVLLALRRADTAPA